jgi:hypothetical protein
MSQIDTQRVLCKQRSMKIELLQQLSGGVPLYLVSFVMQMP